MKFTDVINLVKPSKKGIAKIVHDTPSMVDRMQGAMHGQPLTREKYCRLLLNDSPVMTDAEFERRTNIDVIINAKGDALVAGLGIGLILSPLIERCDTVTVVEKEKDVISLVAKRFPKVLVIHADIFDWLPTSEARFDTIYFDIWPDICPDDLQDARKLHRRFKPFLRANGYMESWCRIALKSLR